MSKQSNGSENGAGRARVKFTHPRDDRTFEAEIGAEATGKTAIDGLVANRFIDAPGGSRVYVLQHTRTGQAIPPSQKFGAAGVADGDTIAVVETEPGAARLSPAELRDRLSLDFEAMMGLQSPFLGPIQAFASEDDLLRSRHTTEGGQARLYVVPFTFRMLEAPGRWIDGAKVRIDPCSGGNFPFTPPSVSVISRPVPFCARVSPNSGAVCIARTWSEKHGQALLAELLVHVSRLLNHDEPAGGDLGLNPAAREYDLRVLRGRPLHPDLVYPAPPVSLTHGADARSIVRGDGFFVPVDHVTPDKCFTPVAPYSAVDAFVPVT